MLELGNKSRLLRRFFACPPLVRYNKLTMKKVSIKINGKLFSVDSDKTILAVALENNIDIPHLCYHPDIEPKAKCGMCLVEIKGRKDFAKACETKIQDGMDISTESVELEEARKNNLKQLLENHLLECDDCVWFLHCQLLELTKKYGLAPKGRKKANDRILQAGTIVFDQTKCIGCRNCIEVCPVDYLEIDSNNKIQLSKDKDCINCGQCIIHCPVGAIEGVGEFEELDNFFKDKNKITVVQFAPSIRTSIGEEFGMKTGEIVTGQLAAGLKKLGFDYVFDTALGADFTTMEESDELIDRLSKNKNLPAMSSCCPAWVKFLEFNHPELINNLCTSRSPQTMLGGIIKNYWCQEKNINPKNVFVVSIMPCVAKKFEIRRLELEIDGQKPVDNVLTTRELFRLFKKKQIDLKTIKPQEADDTLGLPSGAGVIYGSSGGVFESALRTAYFKMTGRELSNNAVKEIRGIKGIKRKEIKIDNRLIKICVVNGIKNAKKVIEEIEKNPKAYDAIEVMACPGGCVGGGGQSLPTTKEIIEKRSSSLYSIDQLKEIKCAHQNKKVIEVYNKFFTNKKIKQKILHTKFSARPKTEIRELKNSRETYE